MGFDASTGAGIGSMFGPAGAGIGALAGGLISGITGLFQKHEGKKLMKNNPYVNYDIPSEVFANQASAQAMANQGLPSEQYNKAMQDIQRQQMTALKNANDRRGGLMSASSIQSGTNNAMLGLNVADAQQKIANQHNLMNVNNQVAGYKDKQWDWNKRNKYQETRDYAMSLMGAGNQNFTGGLDKVGAGIGMLGAGGGYGRNSSGGANGGSGGGQVGGGGNFGYTPGYVW
jgi:hypothetical protein